MATNTTTTECKCGCGCDCSMDCRCDCEDCEWGDVDEMIALQGGDTASLIAAGDAYVDGLIEASSAAKKAAK